MALLIDFIDFIILLVYSYDFVSEEVVQSHLLFSSRQKSSVHVPVILGFASLDVQRVITVELADDVVEHVSIGLSAAGLEALLRSVVQLLEEVLLGWLGDELLAVLLGVQHVPEAILGRQGGLLHLLFVVADDLLELQGEVVPELVFGEISCVLDHVELGIQLDLVVAVAQAVHELCHVHDFALLLDSGKADLSQLDGDLRALDDHGEAVVA